MLALDHPVLLAAGAAVFRRALDRRPPAARASAVTAAATGAGAPTVRAT
jgi:hypothetical protein